MLVNIRTLAVSSGSLVIGGSGYLMSQLFPAAPQEILAIVFLVTYGGLVVFAYAGGRLAIEWWKTPSSSQIKAKLQTVHNSLVAYFNEGNRLDFELDTDWKSVEGTPRMKDWTNRVRSFLQENQFSQADIFAFDNVACNEVSSYQWGHKLRLKVLREIIAKHSKELV